MALNLPCEINLVIKEISNKFNGISRSFVKAVIAKLNIENIDESGLKNIFNYINEIIYSADTLDLSFEYIKNEDNIIKDYCLVKGNHETPFSLNFFIDDFYYNKETDSTFKAYRDSILKLILSTLKKYNTRLLHINDKLKECDNMDTFRIYGELLTANLYKLKNINSESITVDNYYDNNKPITIPLDKRYTPSVNAKMFFKKYSKLKNALKIVSKQKIDTINELDYIESIIYELENCKTIDDVSSVYDEISENIIFKDKFAKLKDKKKSKIKKSKFTKNKNVNFNPIKYVIDGFTFLVGRNNVENDYLTLKYAHKNDIWFHTKDIHGSHCILVLDNPNSSSFKEPDDTILIKCAEIAAFHSKAKNSSNVPVDYCEVKYVKKPNGSKPGMVIYSHNKTLSVEPKNILPI